MLTEIGTIIGIYTFVRLWSLFNRDGDRKESPTTLLLCVIGMAMVALLTLALWRDNADGLAALRGAAPLGIP